MPSFWNKFPVLAILEPVIINSSELKLELELGIFGRSGVGVENFKKSESEFVF